MSNTDPSTRTGYQPGKFSVTRNDGSSKPGGKHEHCPFFALDLVHDKFSRPALEAYRDACREEYPELAEDVSRILASMLAADRQKRLRHPIPLHIYDNGCDIVIAESPADASNIIVTTCGSGALEHAEPWVQILDAADYGFCDDAEDETRVITQLASEWIAQKGRCYLGSHDL